MTDGGDVAILPQAFAKGPVILVWKTVSIQNRRIS